MLQFGKVRSLEIFTLRNYKPNIIIIINSKNKTTPWFKLVSSKKKY